MNSQSGNKKTNWTFVPYIPHTFCFECKTWYNLKSHLKSPSHTANAAKRQSSAEPALAGQEENLHNNSTKTLVLSSWDEQCDELSSKLQLDKISQDDQSYFELLKVAIITQLENLQYTNLKINLYGSSLLGLASKGSDMDISLSCLEWLSLQNAQGMLPSNVVGTLLETLATKLTGDERFTYPCCIVKAKIPILKVFFAQRQIDITLINMLAINNSEFLLYLMKIPLVKSAFIVLRAWSKSSGITFSKYAVKLLLIFHCQSLNPPLVPPISEFVSEEKVCQGWCSSFRKLNLNTSLSNCSTMTLRELLYSFFKEMSVLDFEAVVVDVLNSEVVDRELFMNSDKMPLNQKRLKDNMINNNVSNLNIQSTVCVQDPFCMNHNTTANVTREGLTEFRSICEAASKLCASDKSEVVLENVLKPYTKYSIEADNLKEMISLSFSHCVPVGQISPRLYWFEKVIYSVEFVFQSILHGCVSKT